MTDRMTDVQFAALTIKEKQDWAKRNFSAPYACTVSTDKLDTAAVLADLRNMKRTAAKTPILCWRTASIPSTPRFPATN